MANEINLKDIRDSWMPIVNASGLTKDMPEDYTFALCYVAEAWDNSGYLRGHGNDDLDIDAQKYAAALFAEAARCYGRMGYIPMYPGSAVWVLLHHKRNPQLYPAAVR